MPFSILSSLFPTTSTPEANADATAPQGSNRDDPRSSEFSSNALPAFPGRASDMTSRQPHDAASYMSFPRLREGDGQRGVEGVAAAVVDAVDAIGGPSAAGEDSGSTYLGGLSMIPPPYIVDEPAATPKRFTSVLPPGVVDFAAEYPLITIASLGGISTALLIGSGALTARLYRRLSGYKPPQGLETRLDDLEYRLCSDIMDVRRRIHGDIEEVTRRTAVTVMEAVDRRAAENALKLKAEQDLAEKAVSMPGATSPSSTPSSLLPRPDPPASRTSKDRPGKQSEHAPIAPVMQEARLGQVIRQAMEDVMSARQVAVGQTGKPGSAAQISQGQEQDKMDQVQDSLDRLESVTLGILDEIKALREAKAVKPATASDVIDASQVMTMSELSKMMQRVQADSAAPQSTIPESVEKTSDAVEVKKTPSKSERSDAAMLQAPARPDLDPAEERLIERAVYGYDIRPKDEVTATIQGSGVPKGAAGASGAPSVVGSKAGGPASSAPASGGATLPTTQPDAVRSSRPKADRPIARETIETKVKPRQSTPLPWSSRYPSRLASQPGPLGVDDSGLWYFHCRAHPSNRGWHAVDIELNHRSNYAAAVFNDIFRAMGGTPSVRARIFFNPEAEMIAVDRAVWRCGREGALIVIRDRISDYKG